MPAPNESFEELLGEDAPATLALTREIVALVEKAPVRRRMEALRLAESALNIRASQRLMASLEESFKTIRLDLFEEAPAAPAPPPAA